MLRKTSVMDDRLLRREMYNPTKFRIAFELMKFHAEVGDVARYCSSAGISLGPAKVILLPDSFAILNHAFYTVHWDTRLKGEVVDLIVKFGKAIGDGSKLPSRPDLLI